MKTPGHPGWLIALALALSLTTGHRALDLLAVGQLTGEDPVDAGPLIGAVIMPFLAVPFVTILCFIVLSRFPPCQIGLLQWPRDSNAKGIFWSILFGSFAAGSMVWVAGFAKAIPVLLEQGHSEYATDAAFNLIASLGSIYLWLCLRAVACCPEQLMTEKKSEMKPPDRHDSK